MKYFHTIATVVGIDMHKRKLILNRLDYIRMTILDNSKILIYDVFNNEIENVLNRKG